MGTLIKRNVEYKQTRPGGEEITRTISGINPEAADSTVGAFVGEIANLSENTLTAITDVEYESISATYQKNAAGNANIVNSDNGILVDVQSYTVRKDYVFNAGDNVTIKGGQDGDTIVNQGDNCSISAYQANDTSIKNSGGYASIKGVFSSDCTIVNSGACCSVEVTFSENINVTNSGSDCTIRSSSDNHSDINYGAGCRWSVGSANPFENFGDNVSVVSASGSRIINHGDSVYSSSKNCTIVNDGDYFSVKSYNSNQTMPSAISISGDNCYYGCARVSDSVTVSGDNCTCEIGAGYASNGSYAVVSLPGAQITIEPDVQNFTLQTTVINKNRYANITGFNQANHLVSIGAGTVSHEFINDGADTKLIFKTASSDTVEKAITLTGINSGTLNLKVADNEVTLYNLGGD